MVIVELIGSISLAIAFVGGLALAIIHFQARQNQVECIHDRPLTTIAVSSPSPAIAGQEARDRSGSTAPFSKEVVHVVSHDETSSPSRKYGIQWALPAVDGHDAPADPRVLPSDIDKRDEFNQGDSLSFSDQTTSVKDLIEKFENHHSNSTRKMKQDEK
jgi:hypothetical protein